MPNNKTIREEFEERFEYDNENPALVGKGDAISFLHSTLLTQLSEIEDMVEKKRAEAVKRKNEIKNDPFHPARCQYLGQEDALTYILSALKEKKDKLN